MLRVVLCMLLLATPVQAKLYKVIGADGSITFTDIPPSMDAQEYKPQSINAVSNPQYNTAALRLIIPYENKGGSMTVQGSVNGIPITFIVDTGATLVAIPPEIAQKAGVMEGDMPNMVTAQTANGSVEVPKVSIKQLQVDKVQQSDIAAIIQRVSETNPELGLLGMSFFGRYNMHIDHTRQEIRLSPK